MRDTRIEVAVLTAADLAIAVVDEQLAEIEDARALSMLVPDLAAGGRGQAMVARYIDLLDQRVRLETQRSGAIVHLLDGSPSHRPHHED